MKYHINMTEDDQLAAINEGEVFAFRRILKTTIIPSEAVQIAAINCCDWGWDGYAIDHIIRAGIIPSEEVQIAAIRRNHFALDVIVATGIVPSQAVKAAHYIKWVM